MRKHLFFFLLLVFACLTVSGDAKGQIFTESRLVDIPTGTVHAHGIFTVGTSLAARIDETQVSSDSDLLVETLVSHEELVTASSFYLNFGLFDRVEVGLGRVLNGYEKYADELFTTQAASLKLQLLKEQETGTVPSIAMGIEYRGEGSFTTTAASTFTRRSLGSLRSPSSFLSVSKTFNLPRIHLFSLHVGIGTQRFAFEEQPIGVFAGLSKEFQPAFARGDITLSLEFDGGDMNAGMRYVASSGLQVVLGAETLNNPGKLRYLASVSWTNEQMLEQIDETKRLIRRATALVVETKRAISEKKATDEATEPPPSQ